MSHVPYHVPCTGVDLQDCMYKVYSGEATATMCVCVLQCVAAYCTKYTAEKPLQLCVCVLQCAVACCNVLQCIVQSTQRRSRCNCVRVCVAVYCSLLYRDAVQCTKYTAEKPLQLCAYMCVASCCILLHRVAVYCTKSTAEMPQ